MKLLNPGYENESIGGSLYWNKTSGICYRNHYNETSSCDFTNTGLTNEANSLIDTAVWNVGSNGTTPWNQINTLNFYNLERSNNVGKYCTSGYSCNDTVVRTTTWSGMVGLMYPSDYGFATTGGNNISRNECLNTYIYNWKETDYSECKANNWLYHDDYTSWSMMPSVYELDIADTVYSLLANGSLSYPAAYNFYSVFPVTYLKSSIKITSGTGSSSDPFILLLN